MPVLTGQQMGYDLPAAHRLGDKDSDRLPGRSGLQALFQVALERLAAAPLHHIHDVLEVVIEGLAADAALPDKPFNGDVFRLLVVEQLEELARYHLLGIYSHGLCSLIK